MFVRLILLLICILLFFPLELFSQEENRDMEVAVSDISTLGVSVSTSNVKASVSSKIPLQMVKKSFSTTENSSDTDKNLSFTPKIIAVMSVGLLTGITGIFLGVEANKRALQAVQIKASQTEQGIDDATKAARSNAYDEELAKYHIYNNISIGLITISTVSLVSGAIFTMKYFKQKDNTINQEITTKTEVGFQYVPIGQKGRAYLNIQPNSIGVIIK